MHSLRSGQWWDQRCRQEDSLEPREWVESLLDGCLFPGGQAADWLRPVSPGQNFHLLNCESGSEHKALGVSFQLWEFRYKSFVQERLFPRLSCSQYWSVSAWVLCANLQSSRPLSVGHCGDMTFNQVIPMKWATGLCLIQHPSSPPPRAS